jgi:TctA family transporter
VLGPRFEENFRRAMLIERGDLSAFVNVNDHPISAAFVGLCVLLIALQIFFWARKVNWGFRVPRVEATPSEAE